MTDLVVTGTVYRAGAPRPDEAVLVRDGRIASTGPIRGVASDAGPRAETLDAGDGLVVPGFQDAHVHPLHGGLARLSCDLHDIEGRERVFDAIAAYAAEHQGDEWILGSGWTLETFGPAGPHRSDLDELVGARPAYLVDTNVHTAWASSRALELAGVDERTPDPADGRIERDPQGDPTGTLHEGATLLVERILPPTPPDLYRRALLLAQSELHALGITAWQDAWIDSEQLDVYLDLDRRGELVSRVVTSLIWDRHSDDSQLNDLEELRRRGSDGKVDAGTVKIFLDGVAENFTASILDPYLGASGQPTSNYGIDMIEPGALGGIVTGLDRAGFQVHFHAIGDAAVRHGLDACEAARAANGVRDSRHHIAHVQMVHPDDVPRFAALGVVVNAQPLWAYKDATMQDLTLPFQAPERHARQYPFGSLHRAGATLAFGSDWPVSSPDPLLEMEVAVNRTPPGQPDAEPLGKDERLDPYTALDAFTRGAAFVNRDDDRSGTISVGKRADLAVLDRNIFEAGPCTGEARVTATLIEGRVVYERP